MPPNSGKPQLGALDQGGEDADEHKFQSDQAGLRDLLMTLDLGNSMARDPDGTIRHWSKGCERLYGWRAGEAIGQISYILLRTIFFVSLSEIEAALERDGEWTGDLEHFTKDGRRLIVSAHKVLRRDGAGQPIAVMESIADVTEQREAEKKLAETNARLAQSAKMEALGQLAGGIAHDFNNILQFLQTTLELAANDTGDNQRRLLHLAENMAQRGAGTTSRLLAFARRSELKTTSIMPPVFLARMAELLRPIVEPAIRLQVEATAGVPPVLADAGQLESIFMNLVNNARDALPLGGSIVLRASREVVPGPDSAALHLPPGAYVRLSVIDDGEGISPSVLKRVAEPFFTTKQAGKGTGLGLAMAHGFAEQSKGALSIESAVGRGTRVSIWLPQAVAKNPPRDADKRVVLLVEDEGDLRMMLAVMLSQHGYEVVEAENADVALNVLREGAEPCAMITDVSMPGQRSGLDLIALARAQLPNLPVVIISGFISDNDHDRYQSMRKSNGILALNKPFSNAVLLRNLAAAMDAPA